MSGSSVDIVMFEASSMPSSWEPNQPCRSAPGRRPSGESTMPMVPPAYVT